MLDASGIDSLFFKDYTNALFPQKGNASTGIHCISGKPGNGRREDQIDLTVLAISEHLHEAGTILHLDRTGALV